MSQNYSLLMHRENIHFQHTLLGRSLGFEVIEVASSTIATRLLEGGTTAYRRFNICNIKSNCMWAQLLKNARLFIWDEAAMQIRWGFEAVDRSLRILTEIDRKEKLSYLVEILDWCY